MAPRYYHMCRTNLGKPVEIRMRDGRIHRGVITRVNNSHVYISPVGRSIAETDSPPKAKQAVTTTTPKHQEYGQQIWGYRGFRGYPGYGYGGFGRFGWGWGWGFGIALAAIAAIAFLGFFWW